MTGRVLKSNDVTSQEQPPRVPPFRVGAAGGGGLVRGWQIATVCGVLLVLVCATGGYRSPFLGTVYLPVFFAALAGGPRNSLLTAAGIALSLLFLSVFDAPFPFAHKLLHTLVLLGVAVFASVFAERMLYAIRAANQRASRVERRAVELEWMTDTGAMLESLHDLDSMLSVLLLRLGDVVPCDWAAVYLRPADGTQFQLAQSLGLDPRETSVRTFHPSEQDGIFRASSRCSRWSQTLDSPRPPLPFADLDPSVKSVLLVSLRSADETFGLLALGARTPDAFGDSDCERLQRFVNHIVPPVQRVRLQAMASTDTLTGLNNRRAFFARLKDEVERSRRYHRPLSLVLLDIDFFKRINDTLGHPAGDAALAYLGGLLLRLTRATDYVARVGGEEIAILCLESSGEDALVLAERIRRSVECAVIPFGTEDGAEVYARMTVSLGVASLPEDAGNAESLFQEADKALYRAKGAGRNRVRRAGQEDADAQGPSLVSLPAPRR